MGSTDEATRDGMEPNRGLALLSFALLASSFVFLYRDVITKLVAVWASDDNYSHGFFVAPLAVYFAWSRRQRFLGEPARPALGGLAVVFAGMCLLLAGLMGAELYATEISMIVTIAGAVAFLHGWKRLRIMLFPIGFLVLMAPIPKFVFNQLALPLQFIASSFAEHAMDLCSIPVFREGNIIHLANISLEVEEACSGIRSLTSLLTMGVVYGQFMDTRVWVRLVLAAATVPIAVLANAIRVAGTGMAAYKFGAEAAEGFLHTFSGWLVFLAACIMLAVTHGILKFISREHR